MKEEVKTVSKVTIRFAGDSGDGMQLTGSQFTNTTAFVGNDLNTLPDFPSEIRAPAGTLYGVSGFQVSFGSEHINTPGDEPSVLVAMNPAALKINLPDIQKNAIIIANKDGFDKKSLTLAGYENNPLEDDTLSGYNLIAVPISSLTATALEDTNLSVKEKMRCKNFFALGITYWLFHRPINQTIEWLDKKFAKQPEVAEANKKVLKAGLYYGDTHELISLRYSIAPAQLAKGVYKNISGNEATSLGLVAAAHKADLPLFLGSYPITPATEILQNLSKYKNFNVKTFQAEDEIAGITSAIGAAFGGNLAVTTTSGPGLALKTEALGLAVITELPLVIVNVQRGGPSTGLPTKTEQSDLLQAVYGRNGEAPIPVIVASSPSNCFKMAFEAVRIAVKYMTPVILLTDAYIANGSEPWKIPMPEELPIIEYDNKADAKTFQPYTRNEVNSRPWIKPGTPGMEHRVGGLEKSHIYGVVSQAPDNHDFMVRLRAEKVAGIANDIPELEILGDKDAELIVFGWGSTKGVITEAVERARLDGYKVAQAHTNYVNPLPKNTGEVLKGFKKVLIPEINLGQMARIIKSEFLIDVYQYNRVRAMPLRTREIQKEIVKILGGSDDK